MTTDKPINKIAIYYRVSSDQQVEADTIENQRRLLPKFANEQGWHVVEEFEDPGRSGTKLLERPHFCRMLDRVRAGEFDAVLVRHSDRLTRTEDLEEWGHIMGAFQRTGTLIASPYEGVTDLTNLSGKLFEFTKGLMASEENKKRNERIRETKHRRLDEGVYCQSGSVAYGYKVKSSTKRGTPATVVQSKAEAAILKEVQRLMVEEGVSASKVCVEFNAKGLKTRRGRDWRPSTLCAVLRNTALYGEIVANRWVQEKNEKTGKMNMVERPEAEWKVAYIDDPVFSRAEWQQLNDILDRNRAKGRPAVLEGKYLCRGLLKCDICGARYTTFNGGSGKEHKKYYYACPNRRIPKEKLINGAVPCKHSPIVRHELVDESVWTTVVDALVWPERVLEEWFRHTEPEFIDKDQRELEEIEAQIEELRKKQRRVYSLGEGGDEVELQYVRGRIEHFRALVESLEGKAEKIRKRREEAERQREKQEAVKGSIHRLLEVMESRIEIKETDHEVRKWFKKTRTKRELLGKVLTGLEFEARRTLLVSVVGEEEIRIGPSEKGRKVKPSWSPRPLKAEFETWFQGVLDIDRIVNALKSIDKNTYLKSLNTSRY